MPLSDERSTVGKSVKRTADLLLTLRNYFHTSNALEVSTPVLSRAGVTDPHIHSLVTDVGLSVEPDARYLHTSPEFPMKRLLAAGSSDIYQICRVFRAGEQGRLHSTEFMLCEWYRHGWDHHRLMHEIETLLHQLWVSLREDSHEDEIHVVLPASRFCTYADAIEFACELKLNEIDQQAIAQQLQLTATTSPLSQQDALDDWLNLLMTAVVYPSFATDRFTFLYDYPASQAALAQVGLNKAGEKVAHRFEVFFGPIELANGFHELQNAAEQRARFEQDLQQRQQLGLPAIPIDENLLQALETGLPSCAGVAMGLERLLMVLHDAEHIDQVTAIAAADG